MHFPTPDFLTLLNWGLAIIATVGLVGAIAIAIFAPALAQVFLNGAVAILRSLLSTRIGVALLVGALCLIMGELAGDYHGRTACRAAQVQADQEAVARDQEQGKLAADDAVHRSAALKGAAAKDSEQIHALSKTDATCHPITIDQLR